MSAKEEKLDPRVRRTRALIDAAFQSLLMQKSFDELTVQDIAQEAMVNRATFYAHYRDKYELLDRSMHDAFSRQLRSTIPENAAFNEESVKSLIVAVCAFIGEMGSQCKRMQRQFEPLVETLIKEIMREILLEWLTKQKRSARDGVAPELAATVASWSIYGAAMQWSKRSRRPSAEAFARELLPLVMGGVGRAAA
jgi:AcrR family transcriptional regulator